MKVFGLLSVLGLLCLASCSGTTPEGEVWTQPWAYALTSPDVSGTTWTEVERPWVRAPEGAREAWFRIGVAPLKGDLTLFVPRMGYPFQVSCDGRLVHDVKPARGAIQAHWLDLRSCSRGHFITVHTDHLSRSYLGLGSKSLIGDRWAIWMLLLQRNFPTLLLALAFVVVGIIGLGARFADPRGRRLPYISFGVLCIVLGTQSLLRNTLAGVILSPGPAVTGLVVATPLIKVVEPWYLRTLLTAPWMRRILAVVTAFFACLTLVCAADRAASLGLLGTLGRIESMAETTYAVTAVGMALWAASRAGTSLRLFVGGLVLFKLSIIVETSPAFFGGFAPAFLTDFGFAGWLLLLAVLLFVRARALRLEDEGSRIAAARAHAVAQTTQMLAHDVRRPFSVMRMVLDMLSDARSFEEVQTTVKEARDEVLTATASVEGLIADVMEVGSTAPVVTAPVEVVALVRATLTHFFARPTRSFEINIAYRFGHARKLDVHEGKIERAFLNLVGNALEAMPGRGDLWFESRDVERGDRSFIEISLGNSNSYIPSENIDRLFDPFFTSGKKGGTGLGLAIVKKIVDAHGGSIECRSTRERGVEFVLALPASVEQAARTESDLPGTATGFVRAPASAAVASGSDMCAAAPAATSAAVAAVGLGNSSEGAARQHRVVVVDDSAAIRRAWRRRLSGEAVLAFDGPAALLAAVSERPSIIEAADVVVLDNHYGDGEVLGEDLVREIRPRTRAPIVLSSDDNSPVVPPGFDARIPKQPLSMAEIAAQVERIERDAVNREGQYPGARGRTLVG